MARKRGNPVLDKTAGRRKGPSMGLPRITPPGLVFGVICFGVGILGFVTLNNFLLLLFSVLTASFAFSAWYPCFSIRWISFSRKAPSDIFAGKEARFSVSLAQESSIFPACAVDVADLVDASSSSGADRVYFLRIPPSRKVHASYGIRFLRRGLHPGGACLMTTSFPFGFFRAVRREVCPGDFLVYPRLRYISFPVAGSLLSGIDRPSPDHFGADEEFKRLREYMPGDSYRRIHWKATARHGRLMVREEERFEKRQACIVLDTRTRPGKGRVKRFVAFERGVSLAASAAAMLEMEGTLHRLVLPGEEEAAVGCGVEHMRDILTRLALVSPGHETIEELIGSLRIKAREELVVVVQDSDAAANATAALGGRRGRVVDASKAFPRNGWALEPMAMSVGGRA